MLPLFCNLYHIETHTVQRVYFEGINVRGFRGLGMNREHL